MVKAAPKKKVARKAVKKPETKANTQQSVVITPQQSEPLTPQLTIIEPPETENYETPPTALSVTTVKVMVNLAREYIRCGRSGAALSLMEDAERNGAPSCEVFQMLGELYFKSEDWHKSLSSWHRAITMAPQKESEIRRKIMLKVMRCHAQLSLQKLQAGDQVGAAEHLSQSIAIVDRKTHVKVRQDMVNAITTYILDVLAKENIPVAKPKAAPKRIVICLDIIKISEVHTHKSMYVSMAAALAELDENITVDLIATHERQLSLNAQFENYYRPEKIAELKAYIVENVPEALRNRISVQYFESFGLQGVTQTCREILAMKPDVVLYGGGKNGLHANESLLVRHLLYKYVPTAFFFVQSSNVVDARNDIIIARGDYPIVGDPGETLIRHQPYPSMLGLEAAPNASTPPPSKNDRRSLVTACVGVRLDNILNRFAPENIGIVLNLLERNPDLDWYLVGAINPKSLLSENKKFMILRRAKRIFIHSVLPYDKFYHLVAFADLYLQLPGFTGGGGSASIARKNEVPIICFKHSDVASMQPSEAVFAEDALEQGIIEAHKLLNDPKAKEQLVKSQLLSLETRRAEAPAGIYSCLKDAVRIYKSRNAKL